MQWFDRVRRRVGVRLLAGTPFYDGIGGGRRSLAWQVGNPGAVAALAFTQNELRANSRDLVRRNAWAAAGVEAFVSNAIGTGIKPQSMVADNLLREAIHSLWWDWCEEADAAGLTDFYGLQALACRAMLEGGECLVRLRYRRPEDGLPVGLQLQLLEPEHLPATLNQELPSGNVIRAGIEFDRLGRRAAYHLYRSHPGDGSLAPMSGTGALEGALALPQFNQNKRDYLSARWIPQGWQWVDPKKEFDAMLTAIRAGLLSRSEAISAFGYDAEDIDREIAADNQRADELGLVFDSDPRHDRPVPVVDSRPPDELDDPDITNA